MCGNFFRNEGLFLFPYIFYLFKKSRAANQMTAPDMSTSIMLPNHILILTNQFNAFSTG